MGLALYWELGVQTGDAAEVVRLVEKMREAAGRAGFAQVGEVVEARAILPSQPGASESAMADRAWALSMGMRTLITPDGAARIAPAHVVAFRAVSAGAEDAAFGLASYDGCPGYRWQSGCATQGAARRGGPPAFLAAHRALVAVLDKARSLGIHVTAKDDGDFWDTRDPKRILDKLDEWETLTAALARRKERSPRCTLRSDVLPRLQANQRVRKDETPVEGLEG